MKCKGCGFSKLNIDYSGVTYKPYFAKNKDRRAWEREQARLRAESEAESQLSQPLEDDHPDENPES